ncbi:MAG: hypothetical protein J6J23_06345 [Clostridia bacterium]|nr:hypothetical protein [Clostridia bacterium]
MFLGNKFVDGYMYMSMNLLSISMILPIFDNLNGKFNIKNVAIAIIGLVLPLIFNASFFASIYVDVFLGLMFAYIVYTYLSCKRIDYVLFANLSLACFVLCVVKAAGLGLCLIALIIIVLDSIIFRRQEIKEFFRNKINILVCLLPVVAVVVAKVSWNCYLTVFKLNEAWDVSAVTFKSVVKAFVHPTAYQLQIFREFIRRSFVSYFGGCINLSLVAMMILMCLVYLVPSIWDKKKGRDFYFAIALFVGFIVYLVSTLILYWFTYGAYEATTLASFERYCSTYLVACIMLLFYKYVVEMFGDSVENTTKSNFLKYFGVALTLIAFTFVPMITVINVAFNPTREARMVTSDFENFASGLDSEKDRVWFIHCDSSGYYYHQAVFVAKPLMLNDCYTWSPGESRSESDLWSYNISKDDWANELKTGNFTYVYIQQADTIFKETYGSLFESIDDISDYSEYKVQLDGEQVKLVKI